MRCITSIFSAGYFLARRINRTAASLFSFTASSNFVCISSMACFDKPPNVLVYTGDSGANVFKNATKNLFSVLHPDKYVVYELTKSQVLVQPWKENIALLVVLCDTIDESTAEVFRNYLAKDGKMLVFCCNFTMPEIGLLCTPAKDTSVSVKYSGKIDVNLHHGKVSYNFPNADVLATSSNDEPVMMKTTCNLGILVISAVHLILDSDILSTNEIKAPDNSKDRLIVLESILGEIFGLKLGSLSVVPESTPGFVLLKENADLFKKLNAREVPIEKSAQPQTVPLIFESETTALSQFDKKGYFSNLNTNTYGHVTIYFPIITSTMIPAEHLSDVEGAVVIAARQTRGCGRGDNQWISPEGCAMFTLHITFSLSSHLGQRLSVLQHMTSLAVVLAVRKIPGYEKLALGLKWPNDLYYGNDKKMGGVLIKTTVQGKLVHAFAGVGINVSNEFPTYCINSVVKAHNEVTGESLSPLTTEVVIARTLTELELLVDNFMKFGPGKFLALYYLYWLHSNQHITLASYEKEATVKGLDEYGYLIVKTDDGKTLTLQPDGNRFDMMQNLIVTKS